MRPHSRTAGHKEGHRHKHHHRSEKTVVRSGSRTHKASSRKPAHDASTPPSGGGGSKPPPPPAATPPAELNPADNPSHPPDPPQPPTVATPRAAKSPRRWMKVEKFNGSGSIDTFLTKFAICARYNNWSEDDKVSHLQVSLTESAGQLLWDSGDSTQLSFDTLVQRLRRRYGSVGQKERYQAELRDRRRGANESLEELQQDIRRLMTKSYPNEGASSMVDTVAKDYFIAALENYPVLQMKVREQEPQDLETACKEAVRFESYQKTEERRAVRDNKGRGARGTDGLQVCRVEECDG